MKRLVLDGESLKLAEAVRAARSFCRVSLTAAAHARVRASRAVVEQAVREGKAVYGVTTGFGAFSEVAISPRQAKTLQKNILMSHAAGVGHSLPDDIVRLALLLMINSKARGYSGLSPATLKALVGLFNSGVVPVVPEKGSVGASGDLAPLAHLSLVLIGRGRARLGGRSLAGAAALRRAGLKPVTLAAGEGLALVNGTQVMTAIAAACVEESLRLARLADIAAAMSLEVLLGSRTQLHKRIHRLRPHPGQARSAANLRALTEKSDIISSHKDCGRVQDAYSLRCSPQVHGASRDTLQFACQVIETEINSATENPLVFPDGQILSGGNFHGQPVALAMDHLAVALAELASISERRIERMVNPALSGLPSFLIRKGGLNSGFMIAQYTAAALVSENKVLAHPASVDSIPTSANKEDHVSMGTIAARKAMEVLENARTVIAIELLAAAQGLDLFTNLKPGQGTRAAYETLRSRIPHMERDRELGRDIETATGLLDEVIAAAERACGPLL